MWELQARAARGGYSATSSSLSATLPLSAREKDGPAACMGPEQMLLVMTAGVLLLLCLNGGKNSEVVLGVLEIVFRHDSIALRIGVARKLQILLVDMSCRAANLDLGAVGVVRAIQVVAVSTTATTAAGAMAIVRALRSATASA